MIESFARRAAALLFIAFTAILALVVAARLAGWEMAARTSGLSC